MTPQNQRLLDYLYDHPEGVTALDTWTLLGIARCASRIFDIKKLGHTIETETVTVHNRYGEPCSVARYRLIEPADYGVVA